MTIKALYPNVRPSLDLNFARTRALDPRITFTRASTGTFVGSDGLIKNAASGAARFDHNPVTGESLGLLVEEARTNLVRYSQDITNAAWDKGNLTATKETISGPAGTIGYDKIILGTFSNSSGQIRIGITANSGTVYSNSVYVKQGTCRYVNLIQQYNNSSGTGAYFDLQTGTFLTGGGLTASSTRIQALAGGWYRIQITVTDVGPGGSAGFILSPMTIPNPVINGSGGREYNGNGEFIYAYGAQIEAGDFPTSYIPTTATAVTRAADTVGITGDNFANWYNQIEGTTFCSFKAAGSTSGFYENVFSYATGTTSGQQALYRNASNDIGYGALGIGVPLVTLSSWSGINYKAVGAYRANSNIGLGINGILSVSSSSTTPATSNRLGIGEGYNQININKYNGTIARLTYWPTRLPDAQLIALTQ
jgi:hypothetical protein